MKIKIADLDLSLQTRAGTDAETIDNYAEAMADGAHFPEVTVFTDGKTYWLADGFHRVMAAKQIGRTVIMADIHQGTADDAVVYGGTANNKQGKRPTRADVQHFLEMVWARRKAIFGGTPTGGNLAAKCGVSHTTGENFVRARLAEMPNAPVRAARKNCEVKAPVRPTKLIGADGKMYPVRTVPPIPTRTVPQKPSVPPPAKRPCRKGYYIGPDGKEHAIGVILDRFHEEIRENLKPAFTTGTELLNQWARTVLQVKTAISHATDVAVSQRAVIELDNAYHEIAGAVPFCVCRICHGTGCDACSRHGWQTKDQYERNPSEFKA